MRSRTRSRSLSTTTNSPQDLNSDSLYDDITGDGTTNYEDVTAFFEHIDADAVQDNPEAFDFDGDDDIGFGDVVALLRQV